MTVGPLEQARRDFKGGNPELYAYIAVFEAAKTLDSMGDILSGLHILDGHGAANTAWAHSAHYRQLAERMRS